MTQKAIFDHAGCPACVDAEHRRNDAKASELRPVPALVIGDSLYHIFGASLADLS